MTTTRDGWELPISEEQLARLTRDMETAHQETLPAMRASAVQLGAELRDRAAAGTALGEEPRAPGRRRFLLGAGGAAAGLALAACSGGSSTSVKGLGSDPSGPASATASSSASSSASASPSSGTFTGDLRTVALAVALENQAVGAYQTALTAAKAGKLGTVPAAVTTFMTTAMAQHSEHARTWNAVLTGAGKPAITNVPLSDQARVTAALGKATNAAAVARVALGLEDQAAQTYLSATFHVKSPGAIRTAATIAPVEAMHAAILHFVLGQFPVPDTFLPTDKAASPTLLTV
ncbi:ferritin-like domain-containing protein [Streptomyces polygonati]|uniref:Ferritin-like domain-containing protein n=1 Tax=Streptomyces polygonati TaxID=1617087 RepID=A0ABV8HIC9_9ACTN